MYYKGAVARVYVKINTDYLAEYFDTSNRTILRWIKKEKFDPTSVDSIHECKQRLKKKCSAHVAQ